MTTQAELCDICGQPKCAGLTGSFTQWVNSCRCEMLERDEAKVRICGLCGKQLDSGNTGSFTQWVLQPETCMCSNPVVLDSNNIGNCPSSDESPMRYFSGSSPTTVNEVGDLDAGNFPICRYKPISMLGMGGGGLVYLCFDKHLRKNVAVKILRVTKPDQIVQFQAEAKVTARFKHPHIVSILDFGLTETGAPFMVLEYIEGRSLDVLIQERGPLPELVATELFIQIADAIEKGHDYGIFHRDIKSSNIIVSQSKNFARARVIDFGVAMVASTEDVDFQGKKLVGTPKYMCPDQIAGRSFDARSDVYSFGCVMYETLLGRLPFFGNAMVLLEKHSREQPPSFAEISPGCQISKTMELIVMRCLEKNPDARYQSFSELKSALLSIGKVELDSASAFQRIPAEAGVRTPAEDSRTCTDDGGSFNERGTEYSGVPSVVKESLDRANQLVLTLIALLGLGLLSFVGYLLLRPDETEDSRIVLDAMSGTAPQLSEPADQSLDGDSGIRSFEGFSQLAPLKAQAAKLENAFKFAAAESAYSRAISLDEDNSQWYRLRGRSRMYQGKFEEAISDLNTSVRLDPDEDNFRARAEYYLNAGNYAKAEADIISAISVGQGNANNFIVQASINSDMDENSAEHLQLAQRAIAKALSLQPERVEPHAQRLIVEARSNKDNSALTRKVDELVAKNGGNAFVYYCLARSAALSKEWNRAFLLASRSIILNPSMWQSYQLRADALKQLAAAAEKDELVRLEGEALSIGDCKSRAMSDYYKATSLNPSNAKLLVEVASFHRELNQVENEIKYLSQAIELEPNQASLYALRADAKHRAAMNQDAVDDCETAILMGENKPEVYLLKANSLAELDRPEQAEVAFAESLRLAPANADAYKARAKFRCQRGEFQKAILDFDQVLKLRPDDLEAIEGKHLASERTNQ